MTRRGAVAALLLMSALWNGFAWIAALPRCDVRAALVPTRPSCPPPGRSLVVRWQASEDGDGISMPSAFALQSVDDVAVALSKVQEELLNVAEQIKGVEEEIKAVGVAMKEAKSIGDQDELAYLRGKEDKLREKERQLRDEKNKLRDKEKQLRDEKKELRDEKKQLSSAAVLRGSSSSAGVQAETVTGRLVPFARALQQGQVNFSGDAAYLPEGIKWPDVTSSVLHVRYFFQDFLDGVLCGFDREGAGFERIVVCGTAGLGKSAFGAWLCAQAVLHTNRTVVYQSEKLKRCVVIEGGAERNRVRRSEGECDSDQVPELDEATTIFISDGYTPPVVDAFTIFVTSPKRWRWKEFRKAPGGEMLFLPVYREEEMFRLRDLCFPHLDDMGVEEWYWKWGGIPRHVLLETGPLYQVQLEREIGMLGYEDALALLEDKEAAEGMTDVAVHIKIQGEVDTWLPTDSPAYYGLDHRDFASAHVVDRVFKNLNKRERRMVRFRIRTGVFAAKGSRVMTGCELEVELRQQLAAGGNFTVRRMGGRTKSKVITLPALREVRFSSGGLGSVFNASRSELYVPSNLNEAAVDMVVGPCNMILQVTINENHDLKLTKVTSGKNGVAGNATQGLKPIVEAMQLTGDINYYWAVPDSLFRTWAFNNKYIEAGRQVESWQDDPFIKRIVHWILSVDLGPGKKRDRDRNKKKDRNR